MKLGIIVSKPRNDDGESWHALVPNSLVYVVNRQGKYITVLGLWDLCKEGIKQYLVTTDIKRIKCTKRNLRAFAKQFK